MIDPPAGGGGIRTRDLVVESRRVQDHWAIPVIPSKWNPKYPLVPTHKNPKIPKTSISSKMIVVKEIYEKIERP